MAHRFLDAYYRQQDCNVALLYSENLAETFCFWLSQFFSAFQVTITCILDKCTWGVYRKTTWISFHSTIWNINNLTNWNLLEELRGCTVKMQWTSNRIEAFVCRLFLHVYFRLPMNKILLPSGFPVMYVRWKMKIWGGKGALDLSTFCSSAGRAGTLTFLKMPFWGYFQIHTCRLTRTENVLSTEARLQPLQSPAPRDPF